MPVKTLYDFMRPVQLMHFSNMLSILVVTLQLGDKKNPHRCHDSSVGKRWCISLLELPLKTPWTGRLQQQKYIFLQSEFGSLRWRCRQGCFILSPLCLASRWPSSPHVFRWPCLCACTLLVSLPPLLKTPVTLDNSPPWWPQLNLSTSLKA